MITCIEDYLDYVGRFRGSEYGRRFRGQFRDHRGTAELAMLAAPTEEEFALFARVVEVMTASEKARPEELDNEQICSIASRARADSGLVNIFINGFVLARKKQLKTGNT